ncbi:hypothetical protein [Flavobacterium sp.]|uniref:hypothetical protein n=1 Tax=Flavobacterium sp. TaxID=239 RepID=UPI003D2C9543
MKAIILFLISLLFLNCSSKRNNIYGKYSWDGGYDVFESITINPDSTFIFDWYAGLAGNGQTKGRWIKEDKYLILKSDIQPNEKPEYILLEELEKPNDSIEIKVVDKFGSIQGANCITFIGNNLIEAKITNTLGVVKFPKHKFDKLQISFVGNNEIVYYFKSSNLNFFEFEMLEKQGYYYYFVNEKWKIKKNRLFSKRVKLAKWLEKNYYEKVPN